jgi:predicted DNA-binding mobile mystery protein A
MIQEKPYKIILDQMDHQLKPFIQLGLYAVPPKGWIYPIRRAIRMKYRQMGERLGMSPQGAKQLEESEIKGTVSLRTMKAVAQAMDMDFVYGFVPREGSLTALVDKQARIKAAEECAKWRFQDERGFQYWVKVFKEEPKRGLWDTKIRLPNVDKLKKPKL